LFVAAALVAGTLTAISVAAPSGAAGKIVCTKEVSGAPVKQSATLTTVKATVTGCSLTVGGKGTSLTTIKAGAKPVSKTTWAAGKGTTTQVVLSYVAQASKGKCAPNTRLLITAKVTAGTGAARSLAPPGTIDKSYTCETPKLTSYNEPGTKVTF
jgi:hypothetical protein